jgi:hypothetical protein
MKTHKAFVYTEVQISVPFDQAPWRDLNPVLKSQPGLVNKTWLSGDRNNSVGGFYEFDSLEDARRFAYDYFPEEARRIGAAFTTRVFDGAITEEASRFLHSPHYR